jgi:hypothetical protein
MGLGTEEIAGPHHMITPRQYAVAAAAAIASAGLWWLVTRQAMVPLMIAAIGLVQPLTARRERENTRRRLLWAFGFGAFVAAVHTIFRWVGWVR